MTKVMVGDGRKFVDPSAIVLMDPMDGTDAMNYVQHKPWKASPMFFNTETGKIHPTLYLAWSEQACYDDCMN